MRVTLFVTVIAALLALAGCASTSVLHMRPVPDAIGVESGHPMVAMYTFDGEREDGGSLDVKIASYGVETVETGEGAVVTAYFTFRVVNRSGRAAHFPYTDYRAIDDEGAESLAPVRENTDEDAASGSVTVPAGGRRQFDLAFDLTGRTDPERLAAITLSWSVDREGQTEAVSTKFIRYETQQPYGLQPRIRIGVGAGIGSPYYYRHRGLLYPGGYSPYSPYEFDPFYEDPWWRW